MDPLPAIQNYINQLSQPKIRSKTNGAISTNPTVQNIINQQLPAIKTLQKGGLPALGNEIAQNTLSGKTQVEPMLGTGDIEAPEDINTASEYPYTKSPNPVQKLGKGQNQNVRQIRLPHGYKEDEDAANDTLNRLGFQGSADQQYGQIQPKLNELNDWIQNKSSMAKNPQMIKTSDIENAFENNLQGSIRRGELTKKSAQTIRDSYLGQLHDNQTATTFQEDPNLTPQQNTINQLNSKIPPSIDARKVYQMKVLANQDSSAIYKKIDNGGSLTENDKVTLAGRNALDSALSKAHPDVKQATTDMSRIYDAKSSLEKSRFNAPPTPDIVGQVLPRIVSDYGLPPIVKTGLNKTLTNPTALKVGGASAVLAGTGLGAFELGKNSNGQESQAQQSVEGKIGNNNLSHISQTISQNTNSVNSKPSSDGYYHLNPAVPPGQNSPYMTYQQFLQQTAGMNSQSTAYQTAQSKYNMGQEQAQNLFKGNNGMTFMGQADSYFTKGQDVEKSIESGDLNLFNASKKYQTWNAYNSDPNHPNAQMYNDIQTANNNAMAIYEDLNGFPMSSQTQQTALIQPYDSKEQALEKLQAIQSGIAGKYHDLAPAYNVLTGSTVNQPSQGTNTNLPAITQTTPNQGTTGPIAPWGQMPPIPTVNIPGQ